MTATHNQKTHALITVGDATVPVLEYFGKRVVTFAMIDQVHQRPEGTAGRNFRENKNKLIEGEDYFRLTYQDIGQLDEFRRAGIKPNSQGLTVLTQSGYLMLVKSFTDDLAWQVQRELVNYYFQLPPAKSKAHELLRSVQLLVEQEERLQQMEAERSWQRQQIQAIAQRQDDMDGDTGYMTALAFCRKEHIQAPLMFAQKLGMMASDLCRHMAIRTGRVSDERWGTVKSYPVEVLRECLATLNPVSA
ncbi:MAG: ORF6N domain-containing protein [Magnetococcales bacterium]|nr:ORF6N domain-containing protein [Magnetococcales bacterium]